MILGIHHIGFAVENLEENIKFYNSLDFELVKRFKKAEPKAKAAYLRKESSLVELWDFENENEPLVKIVRKHIALETDNIEKDIKIFQNNGFEIIVPITEGVTVKKFAFVKDKQNNYFELYQEGI